MFVDAHVHGQSLLFIPLSPVLQGTLVVVVANLKPAKLAGEPSQAMVLAASCSSGTGELVRPLVPPGE
jgi:hypothetical protein